MACVVCIVTGFDLSDLDNVITQAVKLVNPHTQWRLPLPPRDSLGVAF